MLKAPYCWQRHRVQWTRRYCRAVLRWSSDCIKPICSLLYLRISHSDTQKWTTEWMIPVCAVLVFKSEGRPMLIRPRPRLDRLFSFFDFLYKSSIVQCTIFVIHSRTWNHTGLHILWICLISIYNLHANRHSSNGCWVMEYVSTYHLYFYPKMFTTYRYCVCFTLINLIIIPSMPQAPFSTKCFQCSQSWAYFHAELRPRLRGWRSASGTTRTSWWAFPILGRTLRLTLWVL